MASAEAIVGQPRTPAEVTGLKRRSNEDHQKKIRPLTPSDREQILLVLELTRVFSPGELMIARELIDTVLEKPDQKDYTIYVYDDDGAILGYTCFGPTPGTEGTYDLYWIAVHPALHGSGLGGALDAHAEAFIRSQGGRLMVAETSSRPEYDSTRAFYCGRKYRELARIPGYYRPGDDLVVYGKYLQR